MADIWVLGRSRLDSRSGQLVRADAITYLTASAERLTASRLETDEVAVLISDAKPPLPENFHLALLVELGVARKMARDGDEDLVVLADLDDDHRWDWSVFPVSELWTND
jgi:hypothetical protein